jgi:hypothetical protein
VTLESEHIFEIGNHVPATLHFPLARAGAEAMADKQQTCARASMRGSLNRISIYLSIDRCM